MKIYENKVKNAGPEVKAFGGEMLILFGDNAPDTLKDYCYTIDVLPTKGTIKKGQKIKFDDSEYEIVEVGDIAEKNLVNLGHLTVHFSGDPEQCLSGAIVVEKKEAPDVQIGTVIEINE